MMITENQRQDIVNKVMFSAGDIQVAADELLVAVPEGTAMSSLLIANRLLKTVNSEMEKQIQSLESDLTRTESLVGQLRQESEAHEKKNIRLEMVISSALGKAAFV
ncbi:MAG TPA: hypothetical protein VGK48_28115 [Terriglobia bacterium]|jgi:hypothetical protein